MPQPSQDLIAAFARLGLEKPEMWASSQANEGIPQLARASLLFWLHAGLVSLRDPSWIDQQIKQDLGPLGSPHVPILKRLLQMGVSGEDLVREMQSSALWHVMTVLDGSAMPPEEISISQFKVFETTDEGSPIHPVDGLHESAGKFDIDLLERKRLNKRARPPGK